MRRAFLFSVIFILLFTVFLLLSVFYLNVLQMNELNLAQAGNITKVVYTRDDITNDLLDYLQLSVSAESNFTHTILNISDTLPSPYSNPANTLTDYKSFINSTYSNQTNLLNSSNISLISFNTASFESAPSIQSINSNSSLNLLYSYNNLSKNELIVNGSNLTRNYSVTIVLNETCLNSNCTNATWAGGPPNIDSSTAGMWHFDEGSGTTAADSSGYGNTGSFNSTPNWVGGRFKYGLSFDGVDDFVNASNSTSLDPTSAWTLEAWVYRRKSGVQHSILEKYNWASGYGNYVMRVESDDKLTGYVISGTSSNSCKSTTTLAPNTWYHVAVTFDSSSDSIKCYVNGVIENSTSATIDPPNSTVSLKIGARGDDSATKFNGTIDEVAIYSRAKLADEIAADANLFSWEWGPIAMNSNLSAALHFDEGSGNFSHDSSSNGNFVNFSNSPVNWTNGMSSYALGFNGSTDISASVNDSASLDITGQLTIEAWVKANSLTTPFQNYQMIVVKGSSSVRNYALYLRSDELFFNWDYGGDTDADETVDANLQPNTWYHVAVVFNYSGNSVKLYVNGVEKTGDDPTPSGNLVANNLPLTIGSFSDGTLPFNGTIDEVAIYNRAKSADEIYADANPLHISLNMVDSLNSSISIRNASSGYVNPLTNNTFYLKMSGNGSLNMTVGGYSGPYSLRMYTDGAKASILLKTIQQGVSDMQVILPIRLQISEQIFNNLAIAKK